MGYAARANSTAGKHRLFGKTPQRLRRIAKHIPDQAALDKALANLPEHVRADALAQIRPALGFRVEQPEVGDATD